MGFYRIAFYLGTKRLFTLKLPADKTVEQAQSYASEFAEAHKAKHGLEGLVTFVITDPEGQVI